MMPLEDLKNFSRDVMSGLLEKAGKHKDTLMEAVSNEVAKFLTKINVSEEVRKILEGMTIRVEATVNYDGKTGKAKLNATHKRTPIKRKKTRG